MDNPEKLTFLTPTNENRKILLGALANGGTTESSQKPHNLEKDCKTGNSHNQQNTTCACACHCSCDCW